MWNSFYKFIYFYCDCYLKPEKDALNSKCMCVCVYSFILGDDDPSTDGAAMEKQLTITKSPKKKKKNMQTKQMEDKMK